MTAFDETEDRRKNKSLPIARLKGKERTNNPCTGPEGSRLPGFKAVVT
jgi:hypothetical protein